MSRIEIERTEYARLWLSDPDPARESEYRSRAAEAAQMWADWEAEIEAFAASTPPPIIIGALVMVTQDGDDYGMTGKVIAVGAANLVVDFDSYTAGYDPNAVRLLSPRESEIYHLTRELLGTGLYDEPGARKEAEIQLAELTQYARVWDGWSSVQAARAQARAA